MSIQSEITRIAQNVSDSFDAVAAKGGTRPQAQNSSNLPDAILSIPAAGVQSFNGRTGDVEPQEEDYTAEMVGAQPTINVRGILKGDGAGGISAASAGTDFAPGGFGLGAVSYNAIADCNDTTLGNGFYTLSAATLNYPALIPNASYGILLVQIRGTSIYQSFSYGEYFAKRRYTGAAWTEWEYVNPPMQVGVEYRTTERYLGKPVYVKLVDCGVSASGEKATAHGISNLDRIVETTCYLNKETMPWFGSGSAGLTGAWNAYGYVNGANIAIWTGTSLANKPISARLKYTKTTD